MLSKASVVAGLVAGMVAILDSENQGAKVGTPTKTREASMYEGRVSNARGACL